MTIFIFVTISLPIKNNFLSIFFFYCLYIICYMLTHINVTYTHLTYALINIHPSYYLRSFYVLHPSYIFTFCPCNDFKCTTRRFIKLLFMKLLVYIKRFCIVTEKNTYFFKSSLAFSLL